MKKYIKPSIKTTVIETSNILAGSIKVGISDSPATESACSKGQDFSGSESNSPLSAWDE